MLFDPSPYGLGVSEDTGIAWKSGRHAASQRRSAVDFLTLPALSPEVPATAFLKWRDPALLNKTIERQFRYGPLRAYDVRNPTSAADAFQQAFYAWWGRQCKAPFNRLNFKPVLMDSLATLEVLEYGDEETNKDDPSPLFLAIEVDAEYVYELAPFADELRVAHPMLMRTVMQTIDRASSRTLRLRDPGWFWFEFSAWYFDGEMPTDEEAGDILAERFGDREEIEKYLPSNVRAKMLPDDVFFDGDMKDTRKFEKGALKGAELVRVRNRLKGRARRVCTALLDLQALLAGRPKADLMQFKYLTRNAYEACSLVWESNGFTEEFLDIHFDDCGNNGATTYPGLSPFETNARSIRTQYEQWSRALEILQSLDTLLSLVSK